MINLKSGLRIANSCQFDPIEKLPLGWLFLCVLVLVIIRLHAKRYRLLLPTAAASLPLQR